MTQPTQMTADELRQIRTGLGLKQAALAKVLGLSGNFISMMENGAKAIEPRTALAVRYLAEHPEAMSGNQV